MTRLQTWHGEALATENFPWGSLKEQKQRLGVVARDTRAYTNEFFTHPRAHPWMMLLLAFALMGVAGDALTTYAFLHSPYFSESNGVAAGLMGLVGLHTYAFIAVLAGILATFLLFVRGPNIIAWVLFGGGVTLALFKVFVTVSNLHTFVTFLSGAS